MIKKEDLIEYMGLFYTFDNEKKTYEVYDFGQITSEPILLSCGAGVEYPEEKASAYIEQATKSVSEVKLERAREALNTIKDDLDEMSWDNDVDICGLMNYIDGVLKEIK